MTRVRILRLGADGAGGEDQRGKGEGETGH